MPTVKKASAFTLIELLVAIVISSILVTITVSVYGLFRKSINLDQAKVDISQNGRVAFDRLTRELRQTPDIVTSIPSSPSDTTVPQPGEIEFEDGHAQDLTYHRYYVTGGVLKMQTIEYYFASSPGSRVHWNSVGSGGVSPVMNVISTQDIANDVQGMLFYGQKPLQIYMTTTDGNLQSFTLRTSIYERNT